MQSRSTPAQLTTNCGDQVPSNNINDRVQSAVEETPSAQAIELHVANANVCSTARCNCVCHQSRMIRLPSAFGSSVGQSSLSFRSLPGITASCNQDRCSRQETRFMLTYTLPRWLTTRVITVAFRDRCIVGPELLLRTHRVQPGATKLFRGAKRGDWEMIRDALAEGSGSVRDVSRTGESALWVGTM